MLSSTDNIYFRNSILLYDYNFLTEKIGKRCLIDFIAENTFTIREIHLLFVNIPNFYVFFHIMKRISMQG